MCDTHGTQWEINLLKILITIFLEVMKVGKRRQSILLICWMNQVYLFATRIFVKFPLIIKSFQ